MSRTPPPPTRSRPVELEVGLTRTRCVATELKGGHADNALPQMADATVNCRILPGVSPDAIAGGTEGRSSAQASR